MKDAEFQKLLARLPDLTDDQLAKLETKLRMVISHFGKSVPATIPIVDIPAPKSDWLSPGLFLAMTKYGIVTKITENTIRQGKAFKRWQEKAPRVLADLEKVVAPEARKRFAFLVGSLIVTHFADQEKASPALMISVLPRAREWFEKGFPGYIAAGMVSFALSRE